MEAVLQQVEHLVPVLPDDHQLAVEDVAALRKFDLREVAPQRLAAPRLQVHVIPIDEGECPEAVVLGLVDPALVLRQHLAGERQLRLDRGL
jgi:hypothetical protein